MKKLAEKEYWDSVYDTMDVSRGPSKVSAKWDFRTWLKYITRDYSYFFMWEVLLKRHLPFNRQWKAIEIGCAPGKYILGLNRVAGYEPFGVEYSEKGCRITEKNFVIAGFPEKNVMLADFFDQTFQTEQKGKYDAVLSLGFIEHFDDVSSVVKFHTNLLRSGGYLIMLVPNLRGLNYYFSKFLNADSLALHNISIMDKKRFSALFPESDFEALYLDYTGIFSFGLFNTNRRWKYFLYRVLLLLQRPFDLLFRLLSVGNYVRSRYTSPYLLFIGRKR